ncbi:putative mitochondrial protein [Tanacetum coccineum]|uniref:Mitochondrial protein n=1 Tax=Tanacetum coccineum TaxID=301880 RepID=A0ABQ5IGW1_9ASTR
MNNIFRPFLRKFTLVFLDDILVYSSSIEDHVQHLRQVLKVMRKHTLYAKMSKCVFGTTQVEYLGQVISQDGVATDPTSSFHALQQAMVQSSVLALPNFEKEFIIETDASGYGLKKCHSTDLSMGSLPLCDSEGSLAVIPYKILDRKLGIARQQVVNQWNDLVEQMERGKNSTRELRTDIYNRFTNF